MAISIMQVWYFLPVSKFDNKEPFLYEEKYEIMNRKKNKHFVLLAKALCK